MEAGRSNLEPRVDVLHGVHVADPYRWLEDRSLQETEAWINDQTNRYNAYFEDCPELSAIRLRVRTFLDITNFDQPVRAGAQCFYRRRMKGEEQASIYVRGSAKTDEHLLVPAPADPLDSVKIHQVSAHGTLLAFELRHGGTDYKTIHVIDVQRRTTLDAKMTADWFRGLVLSEDPRGFIYCQDVLTDIPKHTLRWHTFGAAENDSLSFQVPLTDSSRLLLTRDDVHVGAMYIRCDESIPVLDFWITKLNGRSPGSWHHVFCKRRLPFCPVLASGRIFAKVEDAAAGDRYAEFDFYGRELRTIIPSEPGQIRQIMPSRDGFLEHRFCQRTSKLLWWSFESDRPLKLEAVEHSTVTLLPPLAAGQRNLFLTRESFESPPAIYEFDVVDRRTLQWSPSHPAQVLSGVDVSHTNYHSLDGTSIPITIVSAMRAQRKSVRPCLMTAYGGFSVPGTPQFSVLTTILMELGATFVLPHIRGGGDLGPAWHEAGRKRRRQTSIDDFLAAGDWLKKTNLVDPDQLVIFGGSNSGLLVGAAATQRPDLFRAVLCISPLLDMVRYEQFDRASRWREEFGTVADEADFLALYRYSPYHRVEESVDYPAMLFITGDSDDRCNPAHVRKMAAALQNRERQSRPILVDYTRARGHTPVLPLTVRIESLAQRIAFLCHELELPAAWNEVTDATTGT